MKICHVITRMIVGGAQENTLLTIKGHLEKGHEVFDQTHDQQDYDYYRNFACSTYSRVGTCYF